MPRQQKMDPALLQAALEGLEQRLKQVNTNIATVKQMLRIDDGRRTPATPSASAAEPKAPARRRRRMSAAARKRIAEAQKRRWAAFRAKSGGRKSAAG